MLYTAIFPKEYLWAIKFLVCNETNIEHNFDTKISKRLRKGWKNRTGSFKIAEIKFCRNFYSGVILGAKYFSAPKMLICDFFFFFFFHQKKRNYNWKICTPEILRR